MNKKQLQEKINGIIWNACDTLKNSIPEHNYRHYALVILFIKYLSDTYKEEKENIEKKYKGDIERVRRALSRIKFILEEECTFDYLYSNRHDNNIGKKINNALEKISILNSEKMLNIFAGVDFDSEEIFGKPKEKNETLRTLLENFNKEELDFRPSKVENLDIIGNAYEFIIEKFAISSGKKFEEFYTPSTVSILLAKLVKPKENDRIYDPACGTGSLLLKTANEIQNDKFSIYGQENNISTYNICRMNMLLHGIDDAHIECGDTLSNPLHLENNNLMKFNTIISNPPFSLNRWSKGFEDVNEIMDSYNRFEYGIPPKNTGDYAFVQHMIKSLSDDGTMAVVLPHGVLFRGASEEIIRKKIIEDNLIDAVIGLPKNLFYYVTIPTCIIVFKKNRRRKNILFIEASQEYGKGKYQNTLTNENIEKILNTYFEYKKIEKYSNIVSMEEIKENDYNLNINRYVDTFKEEKIDIEQTKKNIIKIENEIQILEDELQSSLKELGL